MQFADAKILIFAKAPVAGQVKTRLGKDIGFDEAVEVYKSLLLHTFDQVLDNPFAQVSCYTTDPEHDYFFPYQNKGINFHLQEGDDLGQRMFNAFKETLTQFNKVLLMGVDCPVLNPAHLQQSLTALEQGNDAVLIPSEDGGYALIGLTRLERDIFSGVEWSTGKVLSQTIKRFKRLGYSWHQLESLWDVDTLEDYHRWLTIKPVKP